MATAKAFPSIKPTSRSFTPGNYPSTDFESLDGTKTHIRYGNRRVNARLTLGFSNISDSAAGLIINNYDEVNSEWNWVKFTDANGVAGIDDPNSGNLLTKEIMGGVGGDGTTRKGLRWRYSGPPQVTSVFKGRCNVSCSFVACLDAP
tara:strand:- start:2802 stop:3242 length:441 start_codon:yes stop_codon:yes gene_type:complete